MRCSECGQEVPVEVCPLLQTDCMKKKDLPCGEYPSPQCTNEDDIYDISKTSERRCKTCGNCHRVEGGIKGMTILACKISGAMVIPVQPCYKPEKWWKAK